MTRIGEYSFYGVKLSGIVTLPDSLEYIDASAFSGQDEMTGIAFGDSPSLKYIGSYAFNASGIVNAVLPDTVVRIEGQAFASCKDLRSIYIPLSVTRIGPMACLNCENITDVYYGGSSKTWQEIEIQYGNDILLDAELHCAQPEAQLPATVEINDGSLFVGSGDFGERVTWSRRSSGLVTISGEGGRSASRTSTITRSMKKKARFIVSRSSPA